MGNSNSTNDDQTLESYGGTANSLEHLQIQIINDIISDYVFENSVNLKDCIKLFIDEKKTYLLACCNVQEKPKPSEIANLKESWVLFCAVKETSSFRVYIVKNADNVITKEQLQKIILDKFHPKSVEFVWGYDQSSNTSFSRGLGYLKASLNSLDDSFVLTPDGSNKHNFLCCDKLIIKYGLNSKVRTKSRLMKILCALHRILASDASYCPSKEEFVNLTGVLVSENFNPKEPSDIHLQDEVIKFLCEIQNHAEIPQKCFENIHKYFCNNKHKYKEIMLKYEMQLLNHGTTPEVTACLSLAIKDRLNFLILSVKLIPREEVAYEMLNDLVGFLVDNKTEHLRLRELQLENMIKNMKSTPSEDNDKFRSLFEIQEQLIKVRKELDYYSKKTKLVQNLDVNEILLLLGEQSKHLPNCLHMLNQQTVHMLIENAEKIISESTSLALVRIIASLSREIKMRISVKHFLLHIPKEAVHWIVKLGLDKRLVTEDIDIVCETMCEILMCNEDPCIRCQAIQVLEMYKEQLSEKATELVELERNYACSRNNISKLLKYVGKRGQMPAIYFSSLLPLNERSIEVLEQLVKSNMKLPESIIRELRNCICKFTDPRMVKSSFEILLKLESFSWSYPVVIELLRIPAYTNYILQHILNCFCSISEMPDILLKEIINLPKSDDVMHFFDRMNLKQMTADLINPNVADKDKTNIIKNLPMVTFPASENILEILAAIISCNPNLRTKAFAAFVRMVPKKYKINKMLGCLDITSLKEQDLEILKAKDCDLIPLLNEIIRNLYSTKINHEELSTLLGMTSISQLPFKYVCLLLNFAKYSSSKEVRRDIKRFIQGTNYGEEGKIDIIENLEFLEGFSLHTDPELKRLKFCVQNGFGISEDIVRLLTDALQSKNYHKLSKEIENILFNISQYQSTPKNVCLSLLRYINAGNTSYLSAEFIAFVANTHQAKLSAKALYSMFRKYENGFMLLCGIANYAKERSIPTFVLNQITKFLQPKENIKTSTLAAAILAHQEERYGNVPPDFSMKLQQDFFCNLLFTKTLDKYGELSEFLQNDDKLFHEKFYVLHGLSSSRAVNNAILRNFAENDWRKEFFCYSLFIEMVQTEIEPYEYHIKEFRDNMNKLHQFLITENNCKSHTIEAVYEALLIKQRTFAFGLRDGINVLIMLQSNAEAIDLLFNHSDSFVPRLKYLWLSYSLQNKKIEYTSTQLLELSKYVVYKTVVMDHFWHKLKGNSSIQQLTEFFQMLTESNLPLMKKEEFLLNGTNLMCVNQWKSQLAQLLASRMLQKKCQVSQEGEIKNKNGVMDTIKGYCWASNTSTRQDTKCLKQHVERYLAHMLLSEWSEQSLSELLPKLDTDDKLIALLRVLIIMHDYKLTFDTTNEKKETLTQVFAAYPVSDWEQKAHKMAVYNSFKGTCTKTVSDILKEICKLNDYTELKHLNEKILQNDFEEIMKKYDSNSEILKTFPKIKFWEVKEIKCWAVNVKQTPQNVDLFEKIAVIKRAVEISCKFKPRPIQILGVLILLQADGRKGCLAQVNTGEGKTVIIAMIAAIHSLNGNTVDVVTSSPELARPQSQDMQRFFSLMELSVAHNTEKNKKMCYKADIVYGAAGNFQGDILRDEYNKLGIRCERSCDVAIVDEVDSMLIDNRNYKVMLSSPMPAMNHLEPLLAAIWLQIELAASKLVEKNGLLLYKSANEFLPVQVNKEEFIKMCTRVHIRKLLRAEKMSSEEKIIYPEVQIPKHLMKLVTDIQLHRWIDTAVYAKYCCEQDRNYIIKDSKIIPVDARNTGVIQHNMHWNDGLHQFLQIKHGLRIIPESLCTNFISNVAYFRRYNKIYGLTGTLGSINAINLLKKVYNVSHVYIPPFKKQQHLELAPIIAANEREHYENIVMSSLSKLNNGRAVLIIAKYIAEAKTLQHMFIHDFHYEMRKVKTYQTETDTSKIKENLKPGEVIIATNIAGRGTDIKLAHEIERSGGLHVCVTFLPSNLRTEKQNVGRTSRMGQKGTSQFIILSEHKSITEIRNERDVKEEMALENAEHEIKKVSLHDEVFERFCKVLKLVQNKDNSNNDIHMKALEERFALWFKLQHKYFEESDRERIMKSFKDFSRKVEADAKESNLIENPFFHVQIGNKSLECKNYKEAVVHYTKAINMDPNFGDNAYYNRGYAYVAEFGNDSAKNADKLCDAMEDFSKAKEIIERNELYLHYIQLKHGAVMEQVNLKKKIYAIQKSAIDNAIEVIPQAIEKKRDIAITHQKLHKVFKDFENTALYEKSTALYEAEIKESENNGCIGSFEVKMIKPSIKWLAFIGLTVLGILQIVCGIVLYCLKITSLLNSLTLGGINDIKDAIEKIIIKRDFDWKKWGIDKAVTFVSNVVVLGCSTINKVAKSCVAGLNTMVSASGNYLTNKAKELWNKQIRKSAKAQTEQLNDLINGLIECGIQRSLIPLLQDSIASRIVLPLEEVLARMSSDECQEAVIRKLVEGIIGLECFKEFAVEIAAEIKHNLKKFSTLNDSTSNDIRNIKYIGEFTNYFIGIFKNSLNHFEMNLKMQEPGENNHPADKSKQLSEEIAAQVSGHVTMLVENILITEVNIPTEVWMKETEDDEVPNTPYNVEALGSEINECLDKSSTQDILDCLSDVAQISIKLVDDKGKWLHTIGKDKVGTVVSITCNDLIPTFDNEWLFSEAEKYSGIPKNKLIYLVVKLLGVQKENELKETLILKLYKEELHRTPKLGIEPFKPTYLCREHHTMIAYRAFTDSKLDHHSQKLDQGLFKTKIPVAAKVFHWHPDFMLYFKHTSNGAKQITEASGYHVVLQNPTKCTGKTCILQIYPCEGGKSNLGNF